MKATYWEKIIVSSERTKQIQAKPHATSSTLSSHHLLAPFPLEPNFWGLPILLDPALHPLLPAFYPHFIKRLCQVTTSSLFQNPVVSVQSTSDNKHLAIPTTPPFWKALSSLDFSYAILNCFSLPSSGCSFCGYHRWVLRWGDSWTPHYCVQNFLYMYMCNCLGRDSTGLSGII